MRSQASWRTWRPSPSMAVSWVAVFIALGGSALALQRNSVGPRHIRDNAVRSKHIKNGQVKNQDVRNLDWGKLTGVPAGFADGVDNTGGGGGPASDVQCTGCVHTADIANGNVTNADLGANAVGTGNVADGSLTGVDLAGNSINSTRIIDNSLTAADLAVNSVGASEIATNAVRAAELGPIQEVLGDTVSVPAGSFVTSTASCPAGTQVIGGGWDTPQPGLVPGNSTLTGTEAWHVTFDNPTSGSLDGRARAICLSG